MKYCSVFLFKSCVGFIAAVYTDCFNMSVRARVHFLWFFLSSYYNDSDVFHPGSSCLRISIHFRQKPASKPGTSIFMLLCVYFRKNSNQNLIKCVWRNTFQIQEVRWWAGMNVAEKVPRTFLNTPYTHTHRHTHRGEESVSPQCVLSLWGKLSVSAEAWTPSSP